MTHFIRGRSLFFYLRLFALAWLILPMRLPAQSGASPVSGAVYDLSGAVVVVAPVTTTNPCTNSTIVQRDNHAGDFTAPGSACEVLRGRERILPINCREIRNGQVQTEE